MSYPFQQSSHEQNKDMSSAHKANLVVLSLLSPQGDSLPTKRQEMLKFTLESV